MMNSEALKKLTAFFDKFRLLRYKKNEVILRPDDTPYGVSLIKTGYVKLYSIAQDGKELTLIIFKPGDFFPIMWAINNTPNIEYLEAMTDVELWRVPRPAFLEFIQNNPDIFLELTSKILVRLGGLLQRMEHLAFGNAYTKAASMILICAERFGEKEGGGVIIQVPLTHRDIANLLGLTRETASIEIKKLERKNLITYRGKQLIVKDVAGLKKESILPS